MPTPRDTAAPDLHQLARDCEARVAAGEKPVLPPNSLAFIYKGDFDPAINVETPDEVSDFLVEAQLDEPAETLFLESLLRAATLPLHPQAPEVAAAVKVVRECLDIWNCGDVLTTENIEDALSAFANPQTGSYKPQLTHLGRALLQLATPDSAPKPAHKLSRNPLQLHAQPIDREEEKAP